MGNSYQDQVYEQYRSFIEQHGWDFSEKDEDSARRLDVQYGKSRAVVKIYTTGTIQVQASLTSTIKEPLEKLKRVIEDDSVSIDETLPFEIEDFPEFLRKNIPTIDPIIIRLLNEAILCLKAGALLGCAFLIGAASEKAIWLLIEAFTQAITDATNRARFESRVRNRYISRAYDEFKNSFKSCKSQPVDPALVYDLDTQIEALFQFYRICRNEVGHPEISPNYDKGILLATMGQFVKYIEAIYRLIDYFENSQVVL